MPVSVIVGGQLGSEGKGKVAHWVCRTSRSVAAVRVGGPNSGHTVVSDSGKRLVFRQLPTCSIIPDVLSLMPAGCYLDPDIVLAEMKQANVRVDRIVID